MRIRICAAGRLRGGPERTLIDDYLTRFDRTGRALGLGPAEVVEIEDRKGGGMAAEAPLLAKAAAGSDISCILDERGRQMPSPEFADLLAKWRDEGRGSVAFLIGGADGLDPGLRAGSDFAISLGPMVWPHMLVRVMLAEQLYRAASILGNSPYHRA